MRPGFDFTVAARQGRSFSGLTVEHLPEQHCIRPGFDFTVASRQGCSFPGLRADLFPEQLLFRHRLTAPESTPDVPVRVP